MGKNSVLRKTVCVLFGGVSGEHEVSLRSAAAVLRNLPRKLYDVVTVGITREGSWLLYTGDPEELVGDWEVSGKVCPAVLSPDRGHCGLIVLEEQGARILPVDVVFPVLHGENGEDGTVQGLLALAGIPCVGCGVLSSAVCMDKAVAHVVFQAAGIPKTKLIPLKAADLAALPALERRLSEELGYPMFVKPANAGSSLGVTKVKSPEDLEDALRLALSIDSKLVVEQAVIGQEVECAVMGNDEPVASEVLAEILPPDGVYDYASKYLNDEAGLYIPAHIPDSVAQEVRALAVRAYRAADCRGLARVDFFVKPDGQLVLNEINTLPGFTSISMFPKLFEASGVTFPQLVDRLIRYALDVRVR